MTIDVATLVFEFKSDSAITAEKALDRLIQKGEVLDAQQKRRRLATDTATSAQKSATASVDRAAQANMALAGSEGAVEKATRSATKALSQQGTTWRQFVADRMSDYMRMEGGHAGAMKRMGAEWKAYKAEATQAATSAAEAQGAVERSARDAAKASAEVRTQRQLEAAAMRELVQATKAYERDQAKAAAAAVRAAREQAAAVASLEARMAALKASVDPVGAAQDRVNAEMREASALYKMGAISAEQYAQAMNVLDQRYRMISAANVGATKAMRGATIAGLDLSRQFADIGVTAAMGMNPLMILIQQGPQIADRFAMMKMEGIGLSAVLKSMGAALLPFLPVLAAIGAVGAVAFGGVALAARSLNQEGGKSIAHLKLTEEQLDRLKDKGTNTAITMGDVFRGTWNYISKGAAEALSPITKWFGELFDKIASGAVAATRALVGGLTGAFAAIMATWRMFPAAFGDLVLSGVNAAITGINGLIEKAIAGINGLIDRARSLGVELPKIAGFSIGGVNNPWSGAAANTANAAGGAFRQGYAQGAAGVDGVLGGLGRAIRDARDARVLKDAGDPNKSRGARTPRDVTEERSAELAKLIAQAQQEELQARLSLERDASKRAALEKQMIDAGHIEKVAEIDKKIAQIRDDKKNTEAAAQIAQLEELKLIYGRIDGLKKQAVDQQLDETLAKQAHAIRMGELDLQIELKEGQAGLLRSTYARAVADREILKLRQQQERLDLEEVVNRGVLGGYTQEEVELAKRRLGVLDQIHADAMEQSSQQSRLIDAISEAADSVDSFKRAFRGRDFRGAIDALLGTIQSIAAAIEQHGAMGGLVTAGSAIASAVGGRAGRAVAGGLGIAGSGLALGAFAGSAAGATALGTIGLSAGMIGSIAALAGPVALAAGALYAAAKLFNVGGKPTNAGAGFDLVTGQISGNKRTEETEQAARQAGETIIAIQDSLKAAGIGLTDSVRGLVIGTRDQTQIYLQSGRELRSAVGDAGAAVDTALKALLEGATYVSDAQKKLVDSALAAGKGFDAIAEILAKYEAAQNITKGLADEILRLTDPKAYDLKAVTDGIEAQRKAAADLQAQGYLTAEQLAHINDQLTTLGGLQTAEVLKRYTEAVNDNSDALRVAEERNRLTLEIMRLNGEGEEALRIERELQLNAMEPELRGLQQLRWAREDEAAAIAKQRQAIEASAALANQRLGLLERFYGAANDNAALTRLQRERELGATIDETSRIILRAIHALDDLKAAEEGVAEARSALQEALDREMAPLTAALDRHKDAVAEVTAAEDALRSVYERTAGELRGTLSDWRGLATSLADFRRGLDTGDAGGGTATSRYGAASAEFERLSALARGGDRDAAGRLQGAIETFLGASRGASATSAAYDADVARARAALLATEKHADAQATIAEQQLAALTSQVEGLIELNRATDTVAEAVSRLQTARQAEAAAKVDADLAQAQIDRLNAMVGGLLAVNGSVLSVAAGVAQLNSAMSRQAAAAAAAAEAAARATAATQATQSKDLLRSQISGYLGTNAAGVATFLGYTREQLTGPPGAMPPDQQAAALALQELKNIFGAGAVPGFATGGGFTVGGPKTGDQNVVSFRANGGEHVNISREDNMAAMVSELRALRAEVAELRKSAGSTAQSSKDTADILTQSARGNLSLKTQAA